MIYYKGKGVPQDFQATGQLLLKLAAKQGDINAQKHLGRMYDDGDGVPKDYTKAAQLFRLAAEQGDAESQNKLGDMYYYGDGILLNYVEAVRYYRLAAEQGDAYGQFNLGFMYAMDMELLKTMFMLLCGGTLLVQMEMKMQKNI